MSNKITNKITGKNFTNRGSFKSRFAGSVIGSVKGLFAGSVMGVFLVGLLFSLVGGVGNLQAQERQQGWFVGVSPFVMDVKLKKTSRITSEERTQVSERITEEVGVFDANAIRYEATVPNFASDDRHMNQFGLASLAVANAAIADAISLCQSGAIPIITEGDLFNGVIQTPDIIYLISYNETTDLTSGLSQLLENTPATTIDTSTASQDVAVPFCKTFFASGLDPSDTVEGPGSDTTKDLSENTEETSKLKGTGISFGFNFEKYSLSFNQLQWSAGDDKLQAQVLLARYFLPYGFSVGGGLASAKLGTSFGSASGTAPALHFAYNRAITKNLQIQVGLFWLGLDLAVQDTQFTPSATTISTPITTTAPTFQRRAIVGLSRTGGPVTTNDYRALQGFAGFVNINPFDTRIVVTATIPSGVNRTTTTSTKKTVTREHHQTAEIKNPATISINFIWRFF